MFLLLYCCHSTQLTFQRYRVDYPGERDGASGLKEDMDLLFDKKHVMALQLHRAIVLIIIISMQEKGKYLFKSIIIM